MAIKQISIKQTLSIEVKELLKQESMVCSHTQMGVIELISHISAYKEEGKLLFPEVYITDTIESITESLIGSEIVRIGRSPKSKEIIIKALKKCAPLAIGGWNIYIINNGDDFEFGLFRSGSSIISIPISESLLSEGNKESNLVLIRQVAEKIVEVKGVKGNALMINFGTKGTLSYSPFEAQNQFIEQITMKVAESIKDQCKIFLTRLFLYVAQNGHGNLSLVIDQDEGCPEHLKDGIILDEKLSFAQRISELKKLSSEESGLNVLEANSKLNGVFNLISGMMMSDGITVFTNNGSICAFNIFLKHPEDTGIPNQINGGARSRTYHVMAQKLSRALPAIFLQSQDGQTQTISYE